MLQQMLEHDPALRPSASDLLVCPYVLHTGDRIDERSGSGPGNSLLIPHWSSHHTKANADPRAKLRVVVLHACPLAIANADVVKPLLWRERGIDDMRESMVSSLSSTHIGISLGVYPASSQEFVKALRSSPDVLVVSGQDVFTENHETPTETFGVVVEDENGGAQSLDIDAARAQNTLEFPKVCVVWRPALPSVYFCNTLSRYLARSRDLLPISCCVAVLRASYACAAAGGHPSRRRSLVTLLAPSCRS